MRALEAIGLIIMAGIVLGVMLTSIWIIIVALRADPDFDDEDDREIYEREYWDRKERDKKT